MTAQEWLEHVQNAHDDMTSGKYEEGVTDNGGFEIFNQDGVKIAKMTTPYDRYQRESNLYGFVCEHNAVPRLIDMIEYLAGRLCDEDHGDNDFDGKIQDAFEMKNTIRQYSLPGYELRDYTTEAIAFLRENEPPEGFFVGFSGGKDSIVSLELCRIAGVKHQAFYSCTRIDPPEVVRFIRMHYPEVTWLYSKMTMWEAIQMKAPPLRMQRWCCDVLKKEPACDHPLKHRIMGIRAEESVRRASRPRIDSFLDQTTCKTIFSWPEWAVWEFIESHKLPYRSLYDEGFSRIGCVVCPFILGKAPGATRQREESMRRWPGIWKAYGHAVKRWWTCKSTTETRYKSYPGETAELYWQAYLRGFE